MQMSCCICIGRRMLLHQRSGLPDANLSGAILMRAMRKGWYINKQPPYSGFFFKKIPWRRRSKGAKVKWTMSPMQRRIHGCQSLEETDSTQISYILLFYFLNSHRSVLINAVIFKCTETGHFFLA
jgi:hypothetical protein